jgi:hypothetical protein
MCSFHTPIKSNNSQMIFLNSNDQNLIVPNVPPFNRYARRKPEALEGWSGKHFDSEDPIAPVRPAEAKNK